MASDGLAKPMTKRSPFDIGEFFQQIFTSISNFVNPGSSRQDQQIGTVSKNMSTVTIFVHKHFLKA